MPIWQIIVTFFLGVGGSVVVLAFAAWLLKTSLTAWLAKDAEAFKARLKADADVEIERLKSSLQMVATEHQVKFSKLHETRAEVIRDLYSKITDVNLQGELFVITAENNPTPYKEREFTELREKLKDVYVFTERHSIYLPESVCVLLDKHLGQLRSNVYSAGIFGRIANPNEHTSEQSYKAFTKAYEDFETGIPTMRKLLVKEFRKMLGVESN
jgi:hypothetical protein